MYMQWNGVVWREPGNHGASGNWVARESLGRKTVSVEPEAGMILEVNGGDYQVTEVFVGFCYVRPMRITALP